MAQEYSPPSQADFDFTDSGYAPPVDSLSADFDFLTPPPPVQPQTVSFTGGIKLSNVIIK